MTQTSNSFRSTLLIRMGQVNKSATIWLVDRLWIGLWSMTSPESCGSPRATCWNGTRSRPPIDDRPPRFTKEMFIHHVAEVTPPETIILTLQAHDPLTGLLISHFELVKEPKLIAPFVSDPQAEASTSLFEDIRIDSLQPDQINSTAEDPNDVLSFIELNSLTGEISFRRRVDYEELTNKVTASIQQTNQQLSNIHVTLQTLQFQVQAIAGDLGSLRVSQATVQLEIIDTNDNSPQFNQAVRAFKNRLF